MVEVGAITEPSENSRPVVEPIERDRCNAPGRLPP
jgi:hypothetical protein